MYADSISYNTAIAACANFGEWKVAVALLREMIDETRRHHPSQQQEQQQEQQQRRRRRHSPRYHSRQRTVAADEFSFASAIRACGVAGQWSAALRLFETMLLPSSPSLLPPPNAVCLNAAVTALAVAGRYPQAISLVVTATQSDHLKEFAAASSSSISSSSQQSSSAVVKPDVTTFNCLIHACSGKASEHWRDAVKLLQLMETHSQAVEGASNTGRQLLPPPDAITYATVVAVLEKAGEWERALLLVDRMRGDGRRSTSTTAVEDSPSSDGDDDVASSDEDPMESEEPLKSSSSSSGGGGSDSGSGSSSIHAIGYAAAVQACLKSGDHWRCLAMLQEMRRRHPSLPPDTASFNCAIAAAAKLGQWRRALELFREISTGGSEEVVIGFGASFGSSGADVVT